MNNYYYYDFIDNQSSLLKCNRSSCEEPLIINCAGVLKISHNFNTCAIRKDYYLLIVLEGELTICLDDKTLSLSSGEGIIFPPQFPYQYYNKSNSDIKYLWLHFTGSHVEKYLSQLNLKPLNIIKNISCDTIAEKYNKIFFITIDKDAFFKNELSLILNEILILIAKFSANQDSKNPLIKSLTYINQNLSEPIGIADLANIESLSISRYEFLFKKITKKTPVKYITELRINKAKFLLETTSLSVTKISKICGYNDTQFFHRVFKRSTSLTPNNYRITYTNNY